MDSENPVVLAMVRKCWLAGDLSYKLHSTQQKIHDSVKASSADEVLVLSSRQLGKSFWAATYAIEFAIKKPNCIVRIMAPTLKQVNDIVHDNFNPICRDAPPGFIERVKSDLRWKLANGSEIRLGALERQHVDSNRGGNASLIITEEGGFVHTDDYKYAVEDVIGPQLLRSGGKLVHVSTPSKVPGHYLHTEVLPKATLTESVYRYTIYDNPQLSIEAIEKAKNRVGGEHTSAWKREYLAEVLRDEETVLVPEFNESCISEHPLPEFSNWSLATDLGFAQDLSAVVCGYWDFANQKAVIKSAGCWDRGTETSSIVKDLKALEAEMPTTKPISRYMDCDPRLQADFAVIHEYAVAIPRKDEKEAALSSLRVAFAKGEVVIDPSCKHLIETLRNQQWNNKRTDWLRTQILGHGDSLAALIYWYRMLNKQNPYPANFGLNMYNQNLNRIEQHKHTFTKAFGLRRTE